MAIREIIHVPAAIAKGILDLGSITLGLYSVGKSLESAPVFGAKVRSMNTELANGLNNHILNKDFLKKTIPGTACTIIEFLKGGDGTGEQGCFKPNWTNFNKFVDNNKFYPAAMIVEKFIADAMFGFHTNLTLTLPLFHIIDDGQSGNDANMLYILGGIAAVDLAYGLTLPSEPAPEHG